MNRNKVYPTYFVLIALVVYGLLYVVPGFIGIGYSFTDWSQYTKEINFIGLANYKEVFFGTKHYTQFIGNTILFTVVTTVFKTCLGIALAVLLTKKIKFRNFHRALIYMPTVVSSLIVGMMFTSILSPKVGLLNTTLQIFGIIGPKWLTDPKLAIWSVMMVDVWKGTGYNMTIFIAAIMSISPTYFEAASIDGATGWDKFKSITLPMIMPTVTVTTVLGVVHGLKVFELIYSLTNGGPGFATEVLTTSVYQQFALGNFGLGTTLSTILFVIMAVVGFFLVKAMMKNEVEE